MAPILGRTVAGILRKYNAEAAFEAEDRESCQHKSANNSTSSAAQVCMPSSPEILEAETLEAPITEIVEAPLLYVDLSGISPQVDAVPSNIDLDPVQERILALSQQVARMHDTLQGAGAGGCTPKMDWSPTSCVESAVDSVRSSTDSMASTDISTSSTPRVRTPHGDGIAKSPTKVFSELASVNPASLQETILALDAQVTRMHSALQATCNYSPQRTRGDMRARVNRPGSTGRRSSI